MLVWKKKNSLTLQFCNPAASMRARGNSYPCNWGSEVIERSSELFIGLPLGIEGPQFKST